MHDEYEIFIQDYNLDDELFIANVCKCIQAEITELCLAILSPIVL